MGITALYPPTIIGGAEISASNLSVRLARRGHDMAILSTAADAAQKEVAYETYMDLIRVRRQPMPRSYTAFDYAAHSVLEKLVWHGQDHLDPRNQTIWGEAIDDVKPDLALVHVTQGLGYNGLVELGKRDIPTIFVLHDLSLACYKTSMFVNGKACQGQCRACSLSSWLKFRYLSKIPRIGFVSPSRSNYETVAQYVPIGRWPHRVILNANAYPGPSESWTESPTLRLMYAGQISNAKGVEFILKIVGELDDSLDVSLRVVGGGPELARLQAQYAGHPRITFTGKVHESLVSTYMAESDLLCTPSLWADNSPGVIIQAINGGLPVLGSDKGGIPELVADGVTGAIIEAGNEAAWTKTIVDLCGDRPRIRQWSANALAAAKRFDPEASVDAYLEFAEQIISRRETATVSSA